MKKFLLTFLAFTAGFLPLAAQDWAPFKMGCTPYFQAGDSIYSLRLTGVQVQGNDSVFEFNPRVIPTDPNGFEAKRSYNNIFGQKMLKSSDGTNYEFGFTSGNSVLLKPKVSVGTSWVFSQALQLMATMQSKTAATVQGNTDSIATILLSNGDSIQISRRFGLIYSRSFYSYFNPATTAQHLSLYRLPEAGIGNGLNAFAIFDYQPGDKFLYEGFYDSWFQPCYSYKKTIEVLGRDQTQDSIVYKLRQRMLKSVATNSPCQGPFNSIITNYDTVTFIVRPYRYLSLSDLSNEYAPKTNNYQSFNLPNFGQFISSYHNRLASHFEAMHLADSINGIYQAAIDAQGFYQYAEGLGMVHTESDPSRFETLVAYIKGAETYGNWQPLVLSAEDEVAANPVQVYPNPFTNELSIKLLEQTPAEITIYNLQGQKIQVLQTNGNASPQLSHLPSGLYLLQVKQGDKSYTTKIQKQ